MSSILFDAPGPKARARYRILGVVTALVILLIVGFILLRFAESGQFEAKKWQLFTFPLVQQTIAQSVGATLSAFGTAAVLSLILGILLAFGRLSDRRWISAPYYGFPTVGVQGITPFSAVVAGLVLYNGSVLAEVFRAGIESLPRGQSEAGYAIGLPKSAVMTNILLPQAVRSMLPVIISQLVVILKDTALGFIVTYNEILFQAKFFGSQIQYGSPIIPAAIVAAVLYVGMCLILAAFAKWLERRLSRKPGAAVTPAAAVPAEV